MTPKLAALHGTIQAEVARRPDMTLADLRRWLKDNRADLRGEYHVIEDLPLLPPPHRPGGPPLMIG